MSLKKDKKDNKLSPKYYGSYKMLQNIGAVAYKLSFLHLPEYTQFFMFHA